MRSMLCLLMLFPMVSVAEDNSDWRQNNERQYRIIQQEERYQQREMEKDLRREQEERRQNYQNTQPSIWHDGRRSRSLMNPR